MAAPMEDINDIAEIVPACAGQHRPFCGICKKSTGDSGKRTDYTNSIVSSSLSVFTTSPIIEAFSPKV
jgi:hypothetical protein